MKGTLRLGRVAGIEIDAHWSLLAIALLIWLDLSQVVLPDLAPGLGAAAYWSTGAAMLVLLYSSLVAHELAHSLVAERKGLTVKRITLWLLGGVSELGGDSRSANDELRIAIVGPATSFGAGLLFAGIAVASDVAGAPDLLVTAVVWLGLINFVLALFNLLPAFPLDGGRVLRAVLWMTNGDEEQATRTAGQTSKVVAFGMIAFGVALFVAGVGFTGLWFVVLGWFVLNAAKGETQQVLAAKALEGTTVAQLMTPRPTTVHEDVSVQDLIDHYVLGRHHSSYPVIGGGERPVGLVTLDDIRRLPPYRRSTAPVREIMTPIETVPTLSPEAPARDSLDQLLASGTGRALVLDGSGRLVGIVSLTDVARAVDRRSLVEPDGGTTGATP